MLPVFPYTEKTIQLDFLCGDRPPGQQRMKTTKGQHLRQLRMKLVQAARHPFLITVEARNLEHHSPDARKVKHRGPQEREFLIRVPIFRCSLYACMYACMYTYIHTHTHTYIHAYIHTCVYTYKQHIYV